MADFYICEVYINSFLRQKKTCNIIN